MLYHRRGYEKRKENRLRAFIAAPLSIRRTAMPKIVWRLRAGS